MPISVILDANAYIELEGPEEPSETLANIERKAKEAEITLYITPELAKDLERDKDLMRKRRQIAHTRKFPVVPIADKRYVEVKARELKTILFPHATSVRQAPSRESDCRHLAYAIDFGADYFVTNDNDIIKRSEIIKDRYAIHTITPLNLLSLLERQKPSITLVTPKLLIRHAKKVDKEKISKLLIPLEEDYPDILTRWLPKQFIKSSDSIVKIVEIDTEIAAVSISKQKGDGIVKLATFFVQPDYNSQGLGHHLLQNEINSWVMAGVRKVIVTLPLHKKELVRFFTNRGFKIDGLSPRRYERCPEIILGRHFVNQVITVKDWEFFLDDFLINFLACEKYQESNREYWIPALSDQSWSIPFTQRPLSLDSHFCKKGVMINLRDVETDETIDLWDTYRLETDLFPILFSWSNRHAALIPIKKLFADRLFEYYDFQKELFENREKARLRPDNVYYRTASTHGNIHRGTHILFYVSDPEKMIVAVARVASEEKDSAKNIWEKYGALGVFEKEDVLNIASGSKKKEVQAIRFDYLESFPKPVSLSKLKKLQPSVNVQSPFPIPFDIYLTIRRLGGLSYNDK